jgi:dihydrofolate reductase
MRKIIVSEAVSLDGFFSGPHGEIDWQVLDPEFNKYSNELLSSVDTLIFGRVTYQMMAAYWPSPVATAYDPLVAEKMNRIAKIVISETLNSLEWNNSRLIKGDIADEITKLKQQPGKDIAIFGSGSIISILTQLGLIDEYRIIVAPVILGKGKPLFKDIVDKLPLKLIETKMFHSGNVLLCYQPATN